MRIFTHTIISNKLIYRHIDATHSGLEELEDVARSFRSNHWTGRRKNPGKPLPPVQRLDRREHPQVILEAYPRGLPHNLAFGSRKLFCSDEMPFLHGGERGYGGHDGNRNHRPEHGRDRQEKKQTGQFVGPSVRKTESFADDQG